MRRTYTEGDWFGIPNTPGAYGALLVIRGVQGWTPFVHVFGPMEESPTEERLRDMKESNALISCRINDAFLRDGTWPFLWHDTTFARDVWPMPEVRRWLGGDSPPTALKLSDDDPLVTLSERRLSLEEAKQLPTGQIVALGVIINKLRDPELGVVELADIPEARRGPGERPDDDVTPIRSVRVFFLASMDRLESGAELFKELEASGWQVVYEADRNEDDEETGAIVITASRKLVAESAFIGSLDESMEELAAKHGLSYDGNEVGLLVE
jgi:hypothetical protein